MAKWELAISVINSLESNRKQEGDIIAINPYPFEWGKMELCYFLIVIVDGITVKEANNLQAYLFNDNLDSSKRSLNSKSKIIGKRKYSIKLNKLKELVPIINLKKIRNTGLEYQPFKNKNIILSGKMLIHNKHTKKIKR